MSKLLFKTLKVIKDIHISADLLVVKVMEPDKYDCHKFRWLLQYLRGTMYMPLILRDDSINVIKWWVDDFYEMHGYMRGHNGATMSLGCRSEISMSNKQKINRRSRRLSGRKKLYQGYSGRNTLSRCRVSLLTSNSCIMKTS